MSTRIDGDLYVNGNIGGNTMNVPANAVTDNSVSATAAIQRSKLAQNMLQSFPINMTDFRVHDAFQTLLPGTSASDDLGLYGGTFGTSGPLIRTYDVKAAGAVTLYARALVRLPAEYDPGESVSIRVRAGMVTTVADTTATVDIQAYASDKQAGVGSDLCTTSATSINSLTFANKDFALTATALSPGDWLDIRVAIAVNDAATVTAVIAAIGTIELLCDIRG